MPLPLTQIQSAVEAALEKQGAIPARDNAVSALNEAGADVRRLSYELANLIFNAKDPVKLKAIIHAFQLNGINLETENTAKVAPTITFNIVSENTNLNNLFAPER